MSRPNYTYNAIVMRWIDADTVDLRVDCGFYVWVEARFRLFGVDAPERGEPGHAAAVEFVNRHAPAGSKVVVEATRADKYGRFLASVFTSEVMINAELIDEELAVPYFGGVRRQQSNGR